MALDRDSYIFREGTTPNTRAQISSKVKIFSYAPDSNNFIQVGVIGSFGPSHDRGVEAVRGVGFGDQIAELVPQVEEPITLDVDRTALYLSNVFQAFGYRGGIDGLVRSLKHHRWPFDIKQEIIFSELAFAEQLTATGPGTVAASDGTRRALLTFYEACWMNSYSTSFEADSTIITESVSISVSDIIDGASIYGEEIASGNAPAGIASTAGGAIINSLRYVAGNAGLTTNVL